MLTIVTDLENRNWLVYIVQQFRNINKAQFDIRVLAEDDVLHDKHPNVLYYTQNPEGKSLSVVNKSQQELNSELYFFKDSSFCLKNTLDDSSQSLFSFDLFWNAFVFLSRLEEYQSEQKGTLINSYAARHPRKEKESFDIPIVNLYFDQLEKCIRDQFPDLEFGTKEVVQVDLSHDLDYISKTPQLRIKQSAFNAINVLRQITKPKAAWLSLRKSFTFLFKNTSYWRFDDWREMERSLANKSTFYVYSNISHRKGFKEWLFDPSYRLDKKLVDELRALKSEGFQIGIHGSFFSYNNPERLQKEKEHLEEKLGFGIEKSRQHWLRYSEEHTPDIHNALFKFDSTLGWNDRMGFRSGCASLYQPYNHKDQKAYDYQVIPQMIMDSNLFDYGLLSENEQMAKVDALFTRIKGLKKAHVSISWHPRTCSEDYNWHHVYKRIIDEYI